MCKMCHYGCVLLLVVLASNSRASIVLENFESGSLPGGWTVTGAVGTSWKVGGVTGGNPNPIISPPEGSFFARSGEPNLATESDIGILTSPTYSVSFTTLEWLSVGWSGPSYDGTNYFQILDQALNVKAQIDTAQSDGPKTESVNLLSIGLLAGDTFYFRAVDGRNQQNYGWMAFDELKLTGTDLGGPGVVPEASSFLIWGLLGLAVSGCGWHRRERP